MNKPSFSKKSRGFTLVEVCISMGILTITLVPLLGLMANGLSQVGSNIDKNQAVNICQQVYVGAQQRSFYALTTNNAVGATPTVSNPSPTPVPTPILSYFTAEGDAVTTSGSPTIAYTASVTYTTNAAVSPAPPLVTMSIKILKTPGGNAGTGNPVASFVGTVSSPDVSGYNAGSD